MKKLTLVTLLALMGTSLPTLAHELMLKIDKVKTLNGSLLIAVYNQAPNYDNNTQWVVARKIKVTEAPMLISLGDLPAGDYAVKLFQDENDNGQIDKSVIGIPTEPYGFSNNGGSYGQPSFDEAKVMVDKVTEIEIQLR
jgi:uncharacterized protein (DUF2141 family)